MAIPEHQLNTWSHQGSITNSANTGNSVKNAINSYTYFPNGVNFDVYLQGSFKNDTNVRGESDVDVVVELTSVFYNNLNQNQKNYLGLTTAEYNLTLFRQQVENCLTDYYGANNLAFGNKAIKIAPNNNRLDADVLVCCQYRYYTNIFSNTYYQGIRFVTRHTNEEVINFPKRHSDKASIKHQNSNSWFKPTVRIFKNIRNHLVYNHGFDKEVAPSYFIECLISNIPNNQFTTNYQTTVWNVITYLSNNPINNFICLNGARPLWGETQENWSQENALYFLGRIRNLWNNWNH